jgi:hypothetical protein
MGRRVLRCADTRTELAVAIVSPQTPREWVDFVGTHVYYAGATCVKGLVRRRMAGYR